MTRSDYDPQERRSHATWWVIGVVAVLAGAGAAYWFWPSSPASAPDKTVQSQPAEPPRPHTVLSDLEDDAKEAIAASQSADITFTGVRIDDGVPYDYPAGTQVVYWKLAVSDRALGLLEQANKLGAELIHRAFQTGPKVAAVYIDFVGPIVDRYGHAYQMPWISMVMGRRTYEKIDWEGFDKSGLCDFLSHEHVFDGESGTFCGTKGEL